MIYRFAATQRTVFFICALAVGLPIKGMLRTGLNWFVIRRELPTLLQPSVTGIVLHLIGNVVAM